MKAGHLIRVVLGLRDDRCMCVIDLSFYDHKNSLSVLEAIKIIKFFDLDNQQIFKNASKNILEKKIC